jgi:hypothetical protein
VSFEVVPEHFPDPLEARRYIALDYDHDTDLTTPLWETRCQLQTTARPHAAAFAAITNPLTGLAPADYLRATRRDAADGFEQRLLDASDRAYALVIAELKDQFRVAGSFSSLAVSAMRVLDDINRLLAQRGLLPPFTSP